MCRARQLYGLLGFMFLVPLMSQAMTYDNRFIPLYPAPRISVDHTRSSFYVEPMAATASKGINDKQDDNEVGLPEIYGEFDLSELGVIAGLLTGTNPIPQDKRGGKIPFRLNGRVQIQGIALAMHHSVTRVISFGGSMVFLRANSWHEFTLNNSEIVLGSGESLEKERQDVLDALGLNAGHWKSSGFGDIDFYCRFGWGRGYVYKFRYIDAGIRFGVLIPTGQRREENRPPSFALGGDGHWGVYGAIDALIEVKEDIKIGLLARVNQRFAHSRVRRVPVKEEPSIFGGAQVRTRIKPGVTAIFSPYVVFENLRDGLGASVQYTLVSHQHDSWKGQKTACNDVPLNEESAEDSSKWGTDYFTLNLFYDFGKVRPVRGFAPIASLRWDVPAKMLVVNRVPKTHRLTLGIEFAF